ncbi:MAG: glycolate oxidase iron-sulfur subunit [Candidatus Kentron sp. G]|nr:MAG: glycolate oxidase iron-sulfur subunit [Candidatus Kentron sp. G]VFM98472.1 MAG: glycolate oxidase iron-sulfur subunit [Candidatus Kentron sp. G]VFN00876.1 MAG: glycolate oxidase iron-sulfur subunit [Candidatus Kentron sp. G]
METNLCDHYKDTPEGIEANGILRACVHCGLCTATCPTYQLLGDEPDGPRGRIYLIKQVLEGRPVSRITQRHLDRCLICTACETTCPSGVRYHHLLQIGRDIVDAKVPRPLRERLQRLALRTFLPYPQRFAPVFGLSRAVAPVLPAAYRQTLGAATVARQRSRYRHTAPREESGAGTLALPRAGVQPRKVLVLAGCVQSVATPGTNAALARLLGRIGIEPVDEPKAGCCGALSYHLGAAAEGMAFMRKNIDAWWPHVTAGIEGIVISASGCAAMVKDYGHLFRHDPRYAEKAARVSSLVRDPVTLLADGDPARLGITGGGRRIAFHAPCTLQHRLRVADGVASLLTRLGFELTPVADAHLCCGSAGSYSLLQPELSRQLLVNKLLRLEEGKPEVIVTANVGCQLHLGSRAGVPVMHWVEMLVRI